MRKNKRIFLILTLLLVSVFAFGCTAQNDDKKKEEGSKTAIIKDLKGKPFEFDEFRSMYVFTLNNIIRYGNIATSADLEMLLGQEVTAGVTRDSYIRDSILKQLVDTRLIRDYMEKSGAKVSEEEVNKSVTEYKASIEQVAPDVIEYYDLNGITDDDIKRLFENAQYLKKFEDSIYETVKEEFESDPEKLGSTPIRVEASHILLSTEAEAKTVIERINKGEDFAALAKELSTDKVSGENGGELGYFERGRMIKEFSDAAFSMNVGDVSEPVSSQFGFHVIKLTGKETYADIKARNSESEDLKFMFDQVVGIEVGSRISQKIVELSKDLSLDIDYELLGKKIEIKIPQVKKPEPTPLNPDGSQEQQNGENKDQKQEDKTDKKDNKKEDSQEKKNDKSQGEQKDEKKN